MKKIFRNKFLLLILSVALLASCKNPQKANVETVKIGSFFLAVDYAPYLIAKDKHWFEDSLGAKGIKVEYIEFQTLPTVNEAFATGKIDFVFEAEPPAIIGKASGIDIVIRDISCSLVQEILVPTNSKIQTIADLKGKKIAVLAGTSSHYGVLKMLKDNGIDAKDIQVMDMVPPDAKAAFESGQVDAWAVWPPFVEQEEIAGTGRTLPRGDAFINSIMAVRGDFIKDNDAVYKTIDNVFNKTKEWMLANPDSAMMIVSKQLNVPIEVIKKAWSSHDWTAKLNKNVIDDIQAKADFLKETGKIQNAVKVKNDLIPVYSN
ncbi:MAG: aliphatic sulfonate ABC transporter substrate-binding protein [Bacteroidales bacterium]|nr:aliphatic sulfonate ABC transporter substrate-binding protein [Bacteroidales bacterium]